MATPTASRAPDRRRALVILLFLTTVALGLPSRALAETRFDIQTFRPFGAPQDLVMVGQSRPLSHLSLAAGLYVSWMWNPLALLKSGTHDNVASIVAGRLQFDVHAALGLFDWIELGAVMPLLSLQWGGNQEAIGSEGTVSAATLGDLRMHLKFAPPFMRRRLAQGKGFGSALVLTVAFPTGSLQDFTSDGRVTFSPSLIIDYRFKSAWLIAVNLGAWLNRADGEFAGVRVGDMITASIATEVPVLRGRGLFAIGEVYANPIVPTLIHGPAKIPAEWLVGVRWYTSNGLTLTFGGGGGFGCNIDTAQVRIFVQLVFLPWLMKERGAIRDFKQPPPDRDDDGIVNDKDDCPDVPGTLANHGCPEGDRDRDGVMDRVDHCPNDPQGKDGVDGCPLAYLAPDRKSIILLRAINFVTDSAFIDPKTESFKVMDAVGDVLHAHPELLKILVEGHTDTQYAEGVVVSSREYNLKLSRLRAETVVDYLVQHRAIEPGRLTWTIDAGHFSPRGYGFDKPVADNRTLVGQTMNRRVDFFVVEEGARPNKPIVGGQSGSANILPHKASILPSDHGQLPTQGVLRESGSVLPKANTLPSEPVVPKKSNLPEAGHELPSKGKTVLPRANEYNGGAAPTPSR